MTAALSEAAQLPRAPTRKLYEAAVLCTASVITVYACCVNSTHACASPVDVREYPLVSKVRYTKNCRFPSAARVSRRAGGALERHLGRIPDDFGAQRP